MISKLDIERRKTGIDRKPEYIRRVNKRIQELTDEDSRVLKSKKFSHFMERLLRAYSEGEEGLSLPVFMPKNFPNLVVSKFNSYSLESTLIYDFSHKEVFFKRRFTLSD